MKSFVSALVLLGAVTAAPLLAAEQTVTFDVPGMYCASCPFIVESAMGAVDGVISVSADADARTALVVFEDTKTTIAAIQNASASAGYEALPLDAGS